MEKDNHTDNELRSIYEFKNIAVVGISKDETKPSNYVSKYLIDNGFNVFPVNPKYQEIFDRKSYDKVSSIQDKIDIVDIFRKSEDVFEVVEDAIQKEGIKVIWMQKDIYSPQAEKIAKEKGIDVIYNRCMLEEHQRLF